MGVISGGTSGGGGGGGGTTVASGSVTIDFGTDSTAVTTTISDSGVQLTSEINVSIVVSSSRALDELDLAPVTLGVGNIVAGVSFDVIACSDTATGQFDIHWMRI